MKKLTCIVINILLIGFIIFLLDLYCFSSHICFDWTKADGSNVFVNYFKYYRIAHESGFNFRKLEAERLFLSNRYSLPSEAPELNTFRPIENSDKDKSIVLYGCSYGYGMNLGNNETFSYHLGKYFPNYRIYNRALSGLSTTHILFQLKNHHSVKFENPKYFIYVFMVDHFYRNDISGITRLIPFYKLKRNLFILEKKSWKYIQTPIFSYFKQLHRDYRYKRLKGSENKDNVNNEMILYTKKMIKTLAEQIPRIYGEDVKFIVFRYDEGAKEGYDWVFEELKNEGVEVISVGELSEKPFLSNDHDLLYKGHPTAEAWEEVTGLFSSYIKEKGII